MKGKIIISIIVGVVIIVAIGVLVIKNLTKPISTNSSNSQNAKEEFIPLDSSVSVDLIPRADAKAVSLKVSNIPTGTDSIEFEISYDNDKGLRKGANGKIKVNGEKEIERKDILFGTCSKNVCTYDSGITSVSLTMRFNSDNGISIFTKDFPITQ